MTALALLYGIGTGLGTVLVVSGFRGLDIFRQFRNLSSLFRLQQHSRRIFIVIGMGLVVLVATGWPIAALLACACTAVAPQLLLGNKSIRHNIDRTEAIASWVEMLRDTMAAAAGIEGAIITSASAAPEPIRAEVGTLAARLEHQSLVVALTAFADDLKHPTADLVAAALCLASRRQAKRLGELLGSLARSARADATMRMRVEAGRARTKTSVRVVVISTVGMAAGLLVLNRDYLEPYDSTLGQLVLGIVGLCFVGAFWWMARMARVGTPVRILETKAELP